MLMDLFYDTLPDNIQRKRRAHFHAFMIDVHKRVHAVKASAGSAGLLDPILPVARDLANEAAVLCFDEFQVRSKQFFNQTSVTIGSFFFSTGNGHSRCDDITTVIRMFTEIRGCLCYDVEVSCP